MRQAMETPAGDKSEKMLQKGMVHVHSEGFNLVSLYLKQLFHSGRTVANNRGRELDHKQNEKNENVVLLNRI